MGFGARIALLIGATAGLALSPLAERGGGRVAAATLCLCLAVLLLARPAPGRGRIAWLVLLALLAAGGGVLAGAARLRAMDDAAFRGQAGLGGRGQRSRHLASEAQQRGGEGRGGYATRPSAAVGA